MAQNAYHTYYQEDAPLQKDILPRASSVDLYERGRLLLRLLSDRDAVRIMCAPALYGKSVVAYQYAHMAFSFQDVLWVNAQNPRFVIDLDSESMLDTLNPAAHQYRLVIFDALTTLSSCRHNAFFSVVDAFRQAGCEVIVTTRDRSLASACPMPCMLIEACDLLLDTAELSDCSALSYDVPPHLKYRYAPVLFYDRDQGFRRFCSILMSTSPQTAVEALSILALVVAKGSLRTLNAFVSGGAAQYARDVAQSFPHSGIERNGVCFEALPLSMDVRLGLLQVHVGALAQYSTFGDRGVYLEALVDTLLVHHDHEFAYRVLTTCFDETSCTRFCNERNVELDTLLQSASSSGQGSGTSDYQRALPQALLNGAEGLSNADNLDVLTVSADQGTLHGSIEGSTQPMLGQRRLDDEEAQLEVRKAQYQTECASEFTHGGETSYVADMPHTVDTSYTADTPHAIGAPYVTDANHEAEDCDSALEHLSIRLFGGFDVKLNGKRVPSQGDVRKKAKVLVALLVVNCNKELPRFWIERIIWPEAESHRARSSFYNLWSYVRHLLHASEAHDARLCRSRDTVLLREVCLDSDVRAIDHMCSKMERCHEYQECKAILAQIEDIYRGPLLPGIDNSQLEAYRSTYQTKVLDAVVQGIDILNKQGDLRGALHYSSYAFALDPTREDVCYLFMTIQKKLGQFTGAMSTFMGCRKALIDRFGVDGPRRLDALYEEILHEVS